MELCRTRTGNAQAIEENCGRWSKACSFWQGGIVQHALPWTLGRPRHRPTDRVGAISARADGGTPVSTNGLASRSTPPRAIGQRYLLVRRTAVDEGRLTAYLAFAPVTVPWPNWPWPPVPVGPWNCFQKPSRNWAWISTKCGPGTAGTGISPGHGCPCLPRRLSTAGVEKKPLPLPDRPITVTVSLADLRRWLGFITP